MDVARSIRDFNRGRDPERLALKYARMRLDAFVFLRGACHLFYARLPAERSLDRSPAVWACGDLHLENFGSYKGDNRLAYFDINDFDEAALAPCGRDLVRFLASVRLGMIELHLDRPETDRLCQVFLDSYADALATGKARWIERETSEGLIRELLDTVSHRCRPELLDSRTGKKRGQRRLLVDGSKALPVSERQRDKVTAFMAGFAERQPHPGFYRVLDVARRIAGTGSLGLERYVILVEGRGSPDGNFLLDLKRAAPSSLLPGLQLRQPLWESEAHRVVAIQRRVQAVSMAFLQPVRMGRKDYILRALQPAEDRVALDHRHHRLDRLEAVMRSMGGIVAWGHLRGSGRDGSAIADELIEYGSGSKWRRRLQQLAEHCAGQVRADWQTFAAAYDDGDFAVA